MTTTHRALLLAAMPLAALLNACAERSPLATASPDGPPPLAPAGSVTLECRVQVASRAMACGAPSPGGRADLLVGGQDRFVKIRSSNVAVGALPPPALGGQGGEALSAAYTLQLTADVTVQNLLSLPMGTTDGTTPDPAGVRIFFFSPPTVIGGSGEVGVINYDGLATFTASGQPYFAYPGILTPGAVSAAKNWRFGFTAGVTEFSFLLMVAAPLPNEAGWLNLETAFPALAPGQAVALTVTAQNATGSPSALRPVTWSSSDPAVARVDNIGVVVAVAAGEATVTATDGTRSGSTLVTVGPFDITPPTITHIDISPATANAGDAITLTATTTDAGVGVSEVTASLASPDFSNSAVCHSDAPATGTRASGTFSCQATIPYGATAGSWRLQLVVATDWRGNLRTADSYAPVFSGPNAVAVTSPNPDHTAPFIDGFSFGSPTVAAGGSETIALTLVDRGNGLASEEVFLSADNAPDVPGVNRILSCHTDIPGGPISGTFPCVIEVPPGFVNGPLTVDHAVLEDRGGNRRFLLPQDLVAQGFPTSVQVTSPAPDVTPPTLRTFRVIPSGTPGQGVIQVEAFDGGTGISQVSVVLRSIEAGKLAVTLNSETLGTGLAKAVTGTPADGTFELPYDLGALFGDKLDVGLRFEFEDLTGNKREYGPGELQKIGLLVNFRL
jgi:hypothetical protein